MQKGTVLALLVATLSGCHTFQPASLEDLAPGVGVRARVSGAFADSLRSILPGEDRTLEGTYVEARGTVVYIDVPVMSEYQGMRLQTLSQRIEIPENAFVEIERKNLSKSRTGLAVGAVVAAGAALVIAQLSGDSGGGAPPGTGGPVDAVVSTPSTSLLGVLEWLRGR